MRIVALVGCSMLSLALLAGGWRQAVAADTVSVPGAEATDPTARRPLALFAPKTPPQDMPNRPPLLVVTPQREAAAMSFVRQHHPELADLLVYLKQANTREYERAMRELFKTSERLAQAKERDNDRYEIELEIWKLESQVRLLVARITMKPQDLALQEKLRSLLLQRVDLRLKRQRLERDRLAARVERLELDIDSLERERDAVAEQSYTQLLKSVATMRGAPPDSTKVDSNKVDSGKVEGGKVEGGKVEEGKVEGGSAQSGKTREPATTKPSPVSVPRVRPGDSNK